MIKLTLDIWEKLDLNNIVYVERELNTKKRIKENLKLYVILDDTLKHYQIISLKNQKLYKTVEDILIERSSLFLLNSKEDNVLFDFHRLDIGYDIFLNVNFLLSRTKDRLIFKNCNIDYEVICSNKNLFQSIIKSMEFKTDIPFKPSVVLAVSKSYPILENKINQEYKKRKKEIKVKDKALNRDIETIIKKYGDKFYELLHIINKYDPLDLIYIGCPSDEYTPEGRYIIVKLNKGQTFEEIQNVVHKVFVHFFGEEGAGSKQKHLSMAKDIHQWVSQGGLLRNN